MARRRAADPRPRWRWPPSRNCSRRPLILEIGLVVYNAGGDDKTADAATSSTWEPTCGSRCSDATVNVPMHRGTSLRIADGGAEARWSDPRQLGQRGHGAPASRVGHDQGVRPRLGEALWAEWRGTASTCCPSWSARRTPHPSSVCSRPTARRSTTSTIPMTSPARASRTSPTDRRGRWGHQRAVDRVRWEGSRVAMRCCCTARARRGCSERGA